MNKPIKLSSLFKGRGTKKLKRKERKKIKREKNKLP